MDSNTLALVETLSARLGTTAEKMWEVLMVQAMVDAWTCLLWAIPAAIAACWLYRRALSCSWKIDSEPETWGLFFISFIAAFASGVLLSSSVQAFLNPEYRALSYILETLK
jgi:ABC-type sulfate transport system permease component